MRLKEFADPIHKQLPNFVKFACEQLGIKKHPTIDVVDTVPGTDGTTFGRYDPDTDTVYIVANGRHPKDVFRTLAHELVHYKQGQENRLKPDSGETGSSEENEANAKAGIVMRNFNQEHPEKIDEHIVKHGSGYRLLSKKGKNLGDFKSHAAAAKHEGEVEYFKSLGEALLACDRDKWIMMEATSSVNIAKSGMFDDSVAISAKRNSAVNDKLKDFIATKQSNPLQPFGSKDCPFGANGPIGRALPKMRYAHLTHDSILFYTIEGRNPTTIKLYGVFNHDDIGIGQPSNIKKQKSFISKIQRSDSMGN